MYAIILAAGIGVLGGGALGYLLGRYQNNLVNEIRTLKEQARQVPAELPPEPEKPTVTGGAYIPPKEVSTSVDNKQKAGLVETKTPELLDWESKQELEKLAQGG